MLTTPLGSEDSAVLHTESEVVCLSVDGDRAWLGLVIKNSTRSDWIGFQAGWVVEDNGSSGDRIRISTTPRDNPNHAQNVCTRQSLVPNLKYLREEVELA